MLTVPYCRSFPAVRFEKSTRNLHFSQGGAPGGSRRTRTLRRFPATVFWTVTLPFTFYASVFVPNQNCTGAVPLGAPFTGRGIYGLERRWRKKDHTIAGKTQKKPRHFCPAFAVAPMVIQYHANIRIFNAFCGRFDTFLDAFPRFPLYFFFLLFLSMVWLSRYTFSSIT